MKNPFSGTVLTQTHIGFLNDILDFVRWHDLGDGTGYSKPNR